MSDKSHFSKIPELLAPAGSLTAALTAFKAGADAVYAGFDKFNARERTENLTADEMGSLISYARDHGRKVYITLNTLIKEQELREVFGILEKTALLAPDAVIVQDLGVVNMIRRYFPELEIHASTQMGIHNSAGILVAEKMNIKRVILERQITFREVAAVCKSSPIEIEIFVHGALCCSLSGCCLFSSWLGGWSGNRGKCKQPCRRRYFSGDGNGFFFSTQDLCLIEHINTLKKMNIASFKIEGRLRKPDYVRNVVRAYRMALDASDEEFRQTLPKAKAVLNYTYGRHWSEGFRSKKSFSTLIQHRAMGVSGLLCGKVAGHRNNGFNVRLSRGVHLGDRIRIQPESGDEGPSMIITRMSVKGRSVQKARRGDTCFIFCDKKITHGVVFKIGEAFEDITLKATRLPVPEISAELDILLEPTGLSVYSPLLEKKWEKDIKINKAEKHPVSERKLADEFSRNTPEGIKAGAVNVRIKGALFIPSALLRQWRREFWEWFDTLFLRDEHNVANKLQLERFNSDYGCSAPAGVSDRKPVYSGQGKKTTGYRACPLENLTNECDELILPFFCPESRLSFVKDEISRARKRGIKRFRVTSLYGFSLLKDLENIIITTSYPFPACNSLASAMMRELGARKVQAWPELEKNSMKLLVGKSPVQVEIFRRGNPSLLTTRALLPVSGKVTDSRGNNFYVSEPDAFGLTCIFATERIELPRVSGTSDFYECSDSDDSGETSEFNYDHDWK